MTSPPDRHFFLALRPQPRSARRMVEVGKPHPATRPQDWRRILRDAGHDPTKSWMAPVANSRGYPAAHRRWVARWETHIPAVSDWCVLIQIQETRTLPGAIRGLPRSRRRMAAVG